MASPLEQTSDDLRMARYVVHKLGETFDSFKVHSCSILTLAEQWRNLRASFSEVHKSLESRVKELESKKRENGVVANRLQSFMDEVELKRKTLEFEEQSLSERIAEVVSRQNEVKKWMEVIEVQKRGISDREKVVVAKERELLEGLKRVKMVDDEEIRVRNAELEANEYRKVVELEESRVSKIAEELESREKRIDERCKNVELRESVVDERCKKVELRENVVDERCKKVELSENVVDERCKAVGLREYRVDEWSKELELREREIEERGEMLEARETGLNEDIRVMGWKEKQLMKDRQALELREKELDEIYSLLELRENENNERFNGVESKEKELKLREEEMKVQREELTSKEKDIIDCSNVLKVKEEDLRDGRRALKDKEKEINARFASVGVREEEVSRRNRDVELKEMQVNAQSMVVEAKEGALTDHWETLELKGKKIDERGEALELKEKEAEELRREIELKEKQMNAGLQGLELKQKQINDRCKKMEVKEKEISERYKEMEIKEKQINRRKKALELKEKQVEEFSKELELKEKEVKGYCQMLEQKVKQFDESHQGLELKDKHKELSQAVESKEKQLKEIFQAVEMKEKQFKELSQAVESKEKQLSELSQARELKETQCNDASQTQEIKEKQIIEPSEALETDDHDKVCKVKDKEVNVSFEAAGLSGKQVSQLHGTQDLGVKQKKVCSDKLKLKGKQMADRALNFKLNQINNQQNIPALKEGKKGDIAHKLRDKEITELHKVVDLKENQVNDIARKHEVGQKQLDNCGSNLVVNSDGSEGGASMFCAMDGKALQLFLNERINEHGSMKGEVVKVLRSSSNPAQLVLDAIGGFFAPHLTKDGVAFQASVVRSSCLLLLEHLMDMKPEVSKALEKKATIVAFKWRAKMMVQGESEVIVLAFLLLLVTYNLNTLFKKDDLRRLCGMVDQHRLAPRLRQRLGLLKRTNEISGFEGAIKESIQSDNLQVANALDSSSVKIPADIHSLCRSMDGHGVRSYLIEHVKEYNVLHDKILDALRYAPDPAKLVLDVCHIFVTDHDKNLADVNNTACIFLLEQLMKLSTSIAPEVTNKAKDFAGFLKVRLIGSQIPVDHYRFLQFLASFKLANYYPPDELLSHFNVFYCRSEVYRPEENKYLCFALGLTKKITGIIKSLIDQQKLLSAVKYICVFKLERNFPPAPLLEAHLEAVKKKVDEKRKEGTFKDKVDIDNLESETLKRILTCISNFKLESTLAPDRFVARLKELEKEKERRMGGKHPRKRSASPRPFIETPLQQEKRPRV